MTKVHTALDVLFEMETGVQAAVELAGPLDVMAELIGGVPANLRSRSVSLR